MYNITDDISCGIIPHESHVDCLHCDAAQKLITQRTDASVRNFTEIGFGRLHLDMADDSIYAMSERINSLEARIIDLERKLDCLLESKELLRDVAPPYGRAIASMYKNEEKPWLHYILFEAEVMDVEDDGVDLFFRDYFIVYVKLVSSDSLNEEEDLLSEKSTIRILTIGSFQMNEFSMKD